MDFAAATTPRKVAPGEYVHEIPDGWQQGPGAFGGLVLGLLARTALELESDPARPFRCISGAVLAPVVVGEARLKARVLRRGSGLSAITVQLEQQGQLAATADVVCAKSRVSDGDWCDLQPPKLPDWKSIEPAHVGPPRGPVFTPHFEYRPCGTPLYSQQPRAEAQGWIRARQPGARFDVPLAIALTDAWWPAPFHRFSEPRPMSTVAFTLQLFMDPSALDLSQPLAYRASNPLSSGGYTLELRELWTADGRPVTQNQQTFVMIK